MFYVIVEPGIRKKYLILYCFTFKNTFYWENKIKLEIQPTLTPNRRIFSIIALAGLKSCSKLNLIEIFRFRLLYFEK